MVDRPIGNFSIIISDEVASRLERLGRALNAIPNDRLADLKHVEDWKGTFRFIFNERFTDQEAEDWSQAMSIEACEPPASFSFIYNPTL